MKRHYHVSQKDLGERITLTPRVPYSANPAECAHTERVCFAPSLWQCLVGIAGTSSVSCIANVLLFHSMKSGQQPAVYMTRRKLTPPPKIVSDYELTGEIWSTKPIEVVRVGYIDLKALLQEKVKLTSNARHSISKEFYAGWYCGYTLNGSCWKDNPPK